MMRPAAASGDDQPQGALTTAILQREGEGGCCFPFKLGCFPCLPSSWTKVQDWLHLVLLLGVLGSIACIVLMILEVSDGECGSTFCWKQIFSCILILPSTVYFIKMIGQYDMELREKKERHKEAVDNLLEELNRQKEEMQAVARKMAERANTWALGRFADKRRYFEQWIDRVRLEEELYVDPDLVEELRKFVTSWLKVFSGCLLRPEQSPMLKGLEVELAKCTSAKEVCNVASRRLRESKVEFMFTSSATEAQSYSIPTRRQAALTDGSTSFNSGGSAEEAGHPARTMTVNAEGKCGVTWVRCGAVGCSRRSANTPDRMPVTYSIMCVQIRLLSRQHTNLLIAYWMDLALLVFEVVSRRWPSTALVVINEICVVSILACFEQLNDIAILEKQIQIFERHNNDLRQKHEKAMDDWSKFEQLHDLWEYRTMPSLAFYEKVHLRLDYKDQEVKRGGADTRLEWFRYANAQLYVLDLKFGRMEDWRGQEPLAERWKTEIGSELKARAEGESDVEQLLEYMPFMLTEKSKRPAEEDVPGVIEAPLATPEVSPRGSFMSTAEDPQASPRSVRAEVSPPSSSRGGRRSWLGGSRKG